MDAAANGNGASQLDRQDTDIKTLQRQIQQLREDADMGTYMRRGRSLMGMIAALVLGVVAILGYFEMRTTQLIKSAQAEEIARDLDRMKEVAREQTSGMAPMTVVAVQEQRLTAIDQRLSRIEDKLDRALSKRPR